MAAARFVHYVAILCSRELWREFGALNMAGVLPFPLVRRKRAERTAGNKNEDLPSSKRSRQGTWSGARSL